MILKSILFLVGSLAITNAYAQETYNIQVGLHNESSSNDNNNDKTSTTFSGTYYFKNIVIDNTHPFMELDFLQHASKITLNYENAYVHIPSISEETINPIQLDGTFYIDNFIFGVNNQTWRKAFSLKSNTALNYGFESSTTGFNVGYFVTPTTAISFVNSKLKTKYKRSSISLPDLNDSTNTTNSVNSHTVMSFGGPRFLVVDLSYGQIKSTQTKSETNREYSAKFRYYPEVKYFFEGGYTSNSGDKAGDKGKTQLFSAGYSFTPRFAVMLSTKEFSGDVSAEKSSSTSTFLTAGYRF